MAAQTSYSLTSAIAYPGLIADLGPNRIESYLVETVAGIAPGLTVGPGTLDDQCVLGGTAPVGVVVRSLDVENNVSDTIVYAATEDVGVMISGVVWVSLGNTGAKGAAIYSIDATGVIQSGTAGAGQTQLNGELMDTITAAGLARIRLTPQI